MIRICRRLGVRMQFAVVAAVMLSSGLASGQEVDSGNPRTMAQLTVPEFSLNPAVASLATGQAVPATQPAEAEPAEEESVAYDILTTKRLTGDWFGIRTALEDVGIKASPMFYSVYQQNFRGGVNTHNAHEIPGRFDYNFELDIDKILQKTAGTRAPGATFFFRLRQQWRGSTSGDIGAGAYPGYGDNFYGDRNCVIVDKWHYRQRLWDDRIEFRLGKIDSEDYFDNNEYANSRSSQFMNSTLEVAPNVAGAKGIGAYLQVWPRDWLYFATSAIDIDNVETKTGFGTAFHGRSRWVANWELGFLPAEIEGVDLPPGNYRFGWWMDPETKEIFKDTLGGRLHTSTRNGDVGFYMSFDQTLWKENEDPEDSQGLGAFFRYAFAHGDVNDISHFWSLGAQYEGLIETRDSDVLGLGFAQSIMSSQYRDEIDSRADRESVYELYYAIKLLPWVTVTPDVQVITNPGGDKDARDALVGGLRVKVVF